MTCVALQTALMSKRWFFECTNSIDCVLWYAITVCCVLNSASICFEKRIVKQGERNKGNDHSNNKSQYTAAHNKQTQLISLYRAESGVTQISRKQKKTTTISVWLSSLAWNIRRERNENKSFQLKPLKGLPIRQSRHWFWNFVECWNSFRHERKIKTNQIDKNENWNGSTMSETVENRAEKIQNGFQM